MEKGEISAWLAVAVGALLIIFGGSAAFGVTVSQLDNLPLVGVSSSGYSYTGGPVEISDDGQGAASGVHPIAASAFRRAAALTGSEWIISQGLGNAAASSGFHASEPGSPYTAAIDLSVNRPAKKSRGEIEQMVRALRSQGWVAWYRSCKTRSKWCGNEHIHGAYAGIPSKIQLENQITAFLNDGDGLVDKPGSNWVEFPVTEAEKAAVEFVKNNRAPI